MHPDPPTTGRRWTWLFAAAALALGAAVGVLMPRLLHRQGYGRSGIHWELLPNGRFWGVSYQHGYHAQIERLDDAGAFRVKFNKWSEPADWKVQLTQRPFALVADRQYALTFRIRADVARPFSVSVGRPNTPVDSRPLAYRGQATAQWLNQTLLFTAPFDLPDADLWFELGEHPQAITLADVELGEVDPAAVSAEVDVLNADRPHAP